MELTTEQQQRVDELKRMTPVQWDAICKRCGICCMIKLWISNINFKTKQINRWPIYSRRCCSNFDTETRQCRIYDNRLNSANCRKVTIDVILKGNLLPASCGYMEYVFGPAPFPANVDFKTVCPINDESDVLGMSMREIQCELIPESLMWVCHKHR